MPSPMPIRRQLAQVGAAEFLTDAEKRALLGVAS
jgi:hypothetical protein